MENSIIVMDDIVPNWLQEQCEASLPHQPIKFGQKGFTQTWPDMNELPWELKALWCAISYRRHDIKAKIPLFGKAGFLTLLNVQANMSTEEHYPDLVAMDEPYDVDVRGKMVYSDKSNFAVYYMLQGDSGMEFYHRDGTTKFQTVDFKKGRCVIFPARTVHKEIKPKELTPRFSVCYLFTGLYA